MKRKKEAGRECQGDKETGKPNKRESKGGGTKERRARNERDDKEGRRERKGDAKRNRGE